ncbi:MAG: sodium:solute symporter family protein [Planctomycetota bacterium]
MTTEHWAWLFIGITFGLYLLVGWLSRVRESSGFYVAGRGVPAIANGAATAADWMSAASFIGMAGLLSVKGSDGSVYLIGWTGGYVLLALLLAPYLRKFGKFTVPEFVGDRFGSDSARIVAAFCAIFVSLTYVAGQMNGVGIVFSRYFGVPVWQGVVIGMGIVGFFAVLGGMKGITWTQVIQYFVLIVAYLIPAIVISNQMTGNPIPQVGLVSGDFTGILNELHTDLGFDEYTKPFGALSGWGKINVLLITLSLMVGTAGLPHVIVRFYTTKDVRAARYSAFWALLFIAILYTTAPALAIFSRTNLINEFHNQSIEKVRGTRWVEKWEKTELLKFVDKNNDGLLQMAPGNAFIMNKKRPTDEADLTNGNEVFINNDMIVLSTPEVARMADWIIALVAAGGLAAALSTAAGLLLVISSSAAHDLYIHFVDPQANESRKLLVGRIMIIFAVCIAGYFGINPPGFVAEVVAFAFGLAAASFFPVIILGVFDRRINASGAVSGMVVGLVFTASYIISQKFLGVDLKAMLGNFHVAPEGIGAIGCLLNFVVAISISRVTKAPPMEIQNIVDELRAPETE